MAQRAKPAEGDVRRQLLSHNEASSFLSICGDFAAMYSASRVRRVEISYSSSCARILTSTPKQLFACRGTLCSPKGVETWMGPAQPVQVILDPYARGSTCFSRIPSMNVGIGCPCVVNTTTTMPTFIESRTLNIRVGALPFQKELVFIYTVL